MSEDAVHYRDVAEAVGQLRTDVVSELRVLSDRVDRRHETLDARVGVVEVRLAAHERQAMHEGTRDEFTRFGEELGRLADALTTLGKTVAYGAGAGAVLFVFAQLLLAAFL